MVPAGNEGQMETNGGTGGGARGSAPAMAVHLFELYSFLLIIVFVAVFLLCLDFMKRRKAWRLYPPGPRSMPFLGNILQVDFQNMTTSFDKLRKTYGNVFSLQFCWKNVVVLNGFEVMKEALFHKSEDISDRPPFPIFNHVGFKENCQGILTAGYGHGWKEQRRFLISTLKNFGLGKKSLEDRVIEEANFLCLQFQSEQGHHFDPCFLLNNAVGNVISTIIFGDRFEYGDERFKKLLDLLEKCMKAESGLLPQIMNVVPVMVHIPGIAQRFFQSEKDLMNYVRVFAQEHKATRDPEITRDAIDAFFEEIEKAKGDPKSSFNEDNLLFIIVNLFGAGTETTSTTLRWGLLFMLLYPEIQRRVQQEIDTVIGKDRLPEMDDLANMPFTNAVLHETQRAADVVPILFPHRAYRDTKIQGFFIPKGTIIFMNLSSVLKDEKVWEKPEQFYPEHFLDKVGNYVKQEAFMPFSAGRRVCLGEQLARMQLFIFFTSLLQRFTFTIPDGQPKPRGDGVFALTRSPPTFQICAQLR